MRRDPPPLFRRALRDSWRGLLGWTLGLLAALMLYLPLYPSLGGSSDMQAIIDSLPPALIDTLGYELSTGAGYTQSTFFGLIGFVLIVIAATAWGTAAIAGDEETGSLELTLAHGVSRTQLVLERSAAVLVRLAWLGLVSAAIVLILNGPAELDIEPVNTLAVAAAFVGLGSLSATLGIAGGAITGRRVYALAGGAGIAVLSYALNAMANQSEDLDFLHAWTPYHWAYGNTPLSDGADWGGLALLFGISAAFVIVAVLALNRRDLRG